MTTFARYQSLIEVADFTSGLPTSLRVCVEGDLEVFYAPFEYFNHCAKLVIVGLTPGETQGLHANITAQEALRKGLSGSELLRFVKQEASFAGAMRPKLNGMLDRLGISNDLGVSSAKELWASGFDRIHCTSLLKYPVLKGGNNYNGSPRRKHGRICDAFLRNCAGEINRLPNDAIILPLGAKCATALASLERDGLLSKRLPRLAGEVVFLPHPSGENSESVALATEWTYETDCEYAERMYVDYVRNNEGQQRQSKEAYCAVRRSRHRSVAAFRRYRGLAV